MGPARQATRLFATSLVHLAWGVFYPQGYVDNYSY
jgi:hypothetical protein